MQAAFMVLFHLFTTLIIGLLLTSRLHSMKIPLVRPGWGFTFLQFALVHFALVSELDHAIGFEVVDVASDAEEEDWITIAQILPTDASCVDPNPSKTHFDRRLVY